MLGTLAGCAADDGTLAECTAHRSVLRCWDLQLPPALVEPADDEGVPVAAPLIVDFHGWQSTADDQRSISGFDRIARAEGAIIAWPEGISESWNAGPACCEPASMGGIDDVGFVRAMVADISNRYPVDADRVYLTGWSNGCAMAQRVAAEASELIAATACMSLQLLETPPEAGYDPVPMWVAHGTDDAIIEYGPSEFPGALANLETWRQLNQCTASELTAPVTGTVLTTNTGCTNSAEVVLLSIDGAGHDLYRDDIPLDASRTAWEFLNRFPAPG